MARPSEYTLETALAICDRIAAGESVLSLSKRDDMPGQSTIYQWLNAHAEFAEKYARAREIQADTKFDEAWLIASTATNETVQVARLQVDTIKWQASKLAPKRYGDKATVDVNVDGEITHRSAAVSAVDALIDAALTGRTGRADKNPLPN